MHAATPIALGLRAVRGGAVVVAVALDAGTPRVALSTFLDTAGEGDRLAYEPYHVAVEIAAGGSRQDAEAAVAEGRRRQAEAATGGLRSLAGRLQDAGYEASVAVLLVNRAGWITDLLQHSLGAPEHPPVAEGLAVRDALRLALAGAGVRVVEMDEKTLPEAASERLGVPGAELEAQLKDLGAAAGRPWRKEQKLACLAAWLALAGQAPA